MIQPATNATTPNPAPRQPRWAMAGLALGLVLVADWLFYEQPVGWTVGGYGVLLVAALLWWERAAPFDMPSRWLALALVLLFDGCLEQPRLLTGLLGGLGLITLAETRRNGWSSTATVWFQRYGVWAASFLGLVVTDLLAFCERHSAHRRWWRVVGGWVVPLVLASVFGGLFAAANPVIARWVEPVWNGLRHCAWPAVPWARLAFWAILGTGVWCLLRLRTDRDTPAADSVRRDAPAASVGLIGRCLVVFNALFAVETVLDLRYLWAGAHLPAGLTYAQYAHRGAYPLMVAAVVAAAFVVLALAPGGSGEQRLWVRRLVYLWLAQNVFLVISAGWRLYLYVGAYTLTRWRVAAALWMLLVACGLVWIGVRIAAARTNRWLFNVNVLTGLTVLYAGCFLDLDGFIAGFNVRHCEEVRAEGPALDLAYLEHLGPAALPALVRVPRHMLDRPELHEVIARLRHDLDHDLRNWRGWTFRRYRLTRLEFPPIPAGMTNLTTNADLPPRWHRRLDGFLHRDQQPAATQKFSVPTPRS